MYLRIAHLYVNVQSNYSGVQQIIFTEESYTTRLTKSH